MKLEWLKILILLFLIVIFLLYINIDKITKNIIKEVKESFQNENVNTDIQTSFFDLSSNYMTLTQNERGPQPDATMDEIILDIGDSFGNIDAGNIPWDSENKELSTTEALWGMATPQASAVLFSKLYAANQLQDIDHLPYDDTKNKFSYQDPVFGVGTNNADLAATLQVFDEGMNYLQYVMLVDMVAEGKVMHSLVHLVGTVIKAPLELIKRVIGALNKALKIVFNKLVTKFADQKSKKILSNLKNVISKAGEEFKGVKALMGKVVTKLADKVGKLFEKFTIQYIIGLILGNTFLGSTGQVVFIAIFDAVYNAASFTMMALQLSGLLDTILLNSWDATGCCPPGSTALDTIIPPSVNFLLSLFLPPWGDFISTFFPYICTGSDLTTHLKMSPSTPKWLDYTWCSYYYLPWPNYDCTVDNAPKLLGKKTTGGNATGASFDWNNGDFHISYINLDLVAANPDNYVGRTAHYEGFDRVIETSYILGQSGQHFFYCDFSEPTILVNMAQFYYDWSIRNPYPNDDGTVTVDVISKINYVEASSLYTCDIMCEITSITYDPITGENYSESISYDHDRRFYYGCDANNTVPTSWENTSDSTWVAYDDAYDSALYALEWAVHDVPPANPNDTVPTVTFSSQTIITAHRMKNESYNRFLTSSNDYVHANSNASNFTPTSYLSDENVVELLSDYFTSNANYLNILDTTQTGATSLRTTFTNTSDNLVTPTLSNLNRLVTNVITASNTLWNYHKTKSPVGSYVNNQYQLFGCTHIDGTASSAAAPDPINGDEESRFYCDFDVKPYIKRCTKTNMNLTKCMDSSNIELIIYNYYNQNPNKRIQSIKSVKAKGSNACEYIWDEYVLNPTTNAKTFYSNVITDIVYQIDLSSCTFCLPNSNTLYGIQTNTVSPLSAAPTATKYFKNTGATAQSGITNNSLAYYQTSYNQPVFTADTNSVLGPGHSNMTFTLRTNVDYIPRFDSVSFLPLPEIRRPKAPIRVFYPNEVETSLGGYSNDYCSNPLNIEKFILSYNENSSNINKIMKVIRSYTANSNACDMEVDMFINSNNTVVRTTQTFNMIPYTGREGFQSGSGGTEEVFYVAGQGNAYTIARSNANVICAAYGGRLATLAELSNAQMNGADWCATGWIADNSNAYYPITTSLNSGCGNGSAGIKNYNSALAGVNCYAVKPEQGTDPLVYPFNSKQWNSYKVYTYGSQSSDGGLHITPQTDSLSNPYSGGFSFINPYINNFRHDIVPYTTFFNDDLIKGFTGKTKGLYENTTKLYQGLVRTNHLGGSNCTTKCSDPEIIQRIIEQYNEDNTPTDRFGTTQNSMINVVRAATDSNNTCKIIFENKQDLYGDYYLNDKSDSNFYTVNNLYIKQVQMTSSDSNSCVMYPIAEQDYIDISASDIALSSANDFNTYITPARTTCMAPNCRDPSLYNAAINDYQNNTSNRVYSIKQSMLVGNSSYTQSGICDYLINQDINLSDGTLPEVDTVLRVTYKNQLYTNGLTNCDASSYTYKPNNYQLFISDSITSVSDDNSYLDYSVIIDSNNTPAILSYDPTDNVISSRIDTTIINF